MSFKDRVKQDISSVFFSIDEFGDTHEINGKAMTVILDDNYLKEASSDSDLRGIWGDYTTLYVKADDYGDAPKRGALISLDGAKHEVEDVTSDMGVYKIILGRVTSNARVGRVF